MERKYYTAEQILDALYEVGVGAGDISEVMSCLGRMSLNNNSTKVDRKNDNLIRRQGVIDEIMEKVNSSEGQYNDSQLYMWGLFTQIIQEQPNADPVAFCDMDCPMCSNGICYCSYPERRTSDEQHRKKE